MNPKLLLLDASPPGKCLVVPLQKEGHSLLAGSVCLSVRRMCQWRRSAGSMPSMKAGIGEALRTLCDALTWELGREYMHVLNSAGLRLHCNFEDSKCSRLSKVPSSSQQSRRASAWQRRSRLRLHQQSDENERYWFQTVVNSKQDSHGFGCLEASGLDYSWALNGSTPEKRRALNSPK